MFVIVDDFSRYSWVYFLVSKDEVLVSLESWSLDLLLTFLKP